MNSILTLSNLLYFCSFLLVLKPIIEAKNKEPHWFKKNIFLFIIASVILAGNIMKGISDSDDKLNIQRSQYLRDSANTVKYIDSLKRYNLKVITVLAERNLWYDSIQNSIKKIDTAKVDNQEPFISAELANTRHKISNDTLFLYPSIKNYGTGPAFDVSYEAYFFYKLKSSNRIYEYKIAMSRLNGMDIPANQLRNLISNNFYVLNFNKISESRQLFILVIGEYKNKKRVKSDFIFSVSADENDYNWGISNITDELKRIHFNSLKTKY